MAIHTPPRRTTLSLALIPALLMATATSAYAASPEAAQTKPDKTLTELDRVTVTGSRIFRAGFDTLEPASVVSRENIQAYSHTNLIDALTKTPGMSAGVSSKGDQAGYGAGVNFASRFGLGSNRLLTLVNGRRFVGSAPPTVFGAGGGSGIQVDLNAIPAIMVERIESLGIGGAPTYGSDAISGVNNIILRDRFQGAEVQLGYGSTTKDDNHRHSWAAIFGSNFADDRGNITVAVDLDTSEGVNALQRDFYRQGYSLLSNPLAKYANSLQPSRTPDNDGRINAGIPFNTGPADGVPDRVWIRNRRISTMTFGGLVMPSNIGVSRRYQRNGMGELNGFGPDNKLWHFNTAGDLVTFNPGISYPSGNASGGDGQNLLEAMPLTAYLERRTIYTSGSFHFNDHIRSFFELARYEATARETLDQNVYNAAAFGAAELDGGGDDSGALRFSADNPFLSAQARQLLADNGITEFRLSRSSRDLSMNNSGSETLLTRAVLGFDGYFDIGGRSFNWEAALSHGRGNFNYLNTGLIQQHFINAINVTTDSEGRIICDATAAGTTVDSNCQPLNLFGEGVASREALKYVSTPTLAKAQTRQTVFNASLTGALFSLPGGDFSTAAGFEHRSEEGAFNPSEYERLGQGRAVPIQHTHGKYHTNEVFGEILAPLLNPDWGTPGVHRLDLTAKVRRVDNSVAGSFTAYTYGLQYEPFAGIQLRGNKTQSMRAPSIAELYTSKQPAYSSIPEVCALDSITGGKTPALRQRNCAAFFSAYTGADPATFQASPTSTLGTTNGSTLLKSEKANSWTAGIVISPDWLRGLRVAADWYDIDVTDVITKMKPKDIVAGCFDNAVFDTSNIANANRFCSMVTRDPQTGAATSIATEYGNGPVLKFRGWTAEVDYRLELERFGRLDLGFYGYLPKNQGQAANAELPFEERVGTFEEPKRQLRWTAQHRVGSWGAGVAANYTSGAQASLTDTPESRQYFQRDSWTTWDANVSYNFSDSATLSLSVLNVGDDIGPFPYVLDSLGRRYMTRFQYKFQ